KAARLSAILRLSGHTLSGLECLGFLGDQVCQASDLAQAANPVLQVLPKAHSQLAAGLLQTGERVPATTPGIVAGAAADLTPLDKLADVRLHRVVVQRHL